MIPVCGQGMPMPLNEKKPRTRKQRKKQKNTCKTIADRLVLREKAAEMKKGRLLPDRKKKKQTKTSQSPPLQACFLELDWLLLALTSRLLCHWFRDTIFCPWGLITSSVSSLDFCRAEHDRLTWSCVRNVEFYCSHLFPSSPLTPAPQLPPPFPFNSSTKITLTEQK